MTISSDSNLSVDQNFSDCSFVSLLLSFQPRKMPSDASVDSRVTRKLSNVSIYFLKPTGSEKKTAHYVEKKGKSKFDFVLETTSEI